MRRGLFLRTSLRSVLLAKERCHVRALTSEFWLLHCECSHGGLQKMSIADIWVKAPPINVWGALWNVRSIGEILERQYLRQPTRKGILKQLEKQYAEGVCWHVCFFQWIVCTTCRWRNWETQFQDRRHEPLKHFWGRSRSIDLDLAYLLQATRLEGRFERPWTDLPLAAKLRKSIKGLDGKTTRNSMCSPIARTQSWPIFVQTTHELHEFQDEKLKHFAKKQQAVVKDVQTA